VKSHSLATLHTILSTGSPLKPQLFDYVYSNVKSDVVLGSVTGGTDIIACFAGNNMSLPVFRGEIQSLHLGCMVESWNDDGMNSSVNLLWNFDRDREVVGSYLNRGCCVPTPTQRAIPLGLVNE